MTTQFFIADTITQIEFQGPAGGTIKPLPISLVQNFVNAWVQQEKDAACKRLKEYLDKRNEAEALLDANFDQTAGTIALPFPDERTAKELDIGLFCEWIFGAARNSVVKIEYTGIYQNYLVRTIADTTLKYEYRLAAFVVLYAFDVWKVQMTGNGDIAKGTAFRGDASDTAAGFENNPGLYFQYKVAQIVKDYSFADSSMDGGQRVRGIYDLVTLNTIIPDMRKIAAGWFVLYASLPQSNFTQDELNTIADRFAAPYVVLVQKQQPVAGLGSLGYGFPGQGSLGSSPRPNPFLSGAPAPEKKFLSLRPRGLGQGGEVSLARNASRYLDLITEFPQIVATSSKLKASTPPKTRFSAAKNTGWWIAWLIKNDWNDIKLVNALNNYNQDTRDATKSLDTAGNNAEAMLACWILLNFPLYFQQMRTTKPSPDTFAEFIYNGPPSDLPPLATDCGFQGDAYCYLDGPVDLKYAAYPRKFTNYGTINTYLSTICDNSNLPCQKNSSNFGKSAEFVSSIVLMFHQFYFSTDFNECSAEVDIINKPLWCLFSKEHRAVYKRRIYYKTLDPGSAGEQVDSVEIPLNYPTLPSWLKPEDCAVKDTDEKGREESGIPDSYEEKPRQQTDSESKFPWWLLLVAAAGGYAYYRSKQKKKSVAGLGGIRRSGHTRRRR